MNRQSRCPDQSRRGDPNCKLGTTMWCFSKNDRFPDDMERQRFLFPCVLENPGIVVGFSSRLFLLQTFLNSSGPHPAPCSIDNSGSSPGSEGRDWDVKLITSTQRSCTSTPPYAFMTYKGTAYFCTLPSFNFLQVCFFLNLMFVFPCITNTII